MLITLVIIGVVAALTIPNLMQKYTEQTTVKKLQKFYSNLSNAYNLAMKENGPANEWGLTGRDETSANKVYELLFKPYFKIAKNCGINNMGNCLANVHYKYLNNGTTANYATNIAGHNDKYYKIALDDGAAVWWRGNSKSEQPLNINIFYDVNGVKGPNQWGRDLFDFYISDKKVFPPGITSGDYSYSAVSFNNNCKKTAQGWGCAAWVVYKGNMDYLHCNGLDWDKNSCKDK